MRNIKNKSKWDRLENVRKLKGEPLETFKKLRKNVSQSRNNARQNLVKREIQTHILLFRRPQKILIKIGQVAVEITSLMWQ